MPPPLLHQHAREGQCKIRLPTRLRAVGGMLPASNRPVNAICLLFPSSSPQPNPQNFEFPSKSLRATRLAVIVVSFLSQQDQKLRLLNFSMASECDSISVGGYLRCSRSLSHGHNSVHFHHISCRPIISAEHLLIPNCTLDHLFTTWASFLSFVLSSCWRR